TARDDLNVVMIASTTHLALPPPERQPLLAGATRPQRHVRTFRGHDGLHKYPGKRSLSAVDAHDGWNAGDVVNRPNKRAPTRRSAPSNGWWPRWPGRRRTGRSARPPTRGHAEYQATFNVIGPSSDSASPSPDCAAVSPSQASSPVPSCTAPANRRLEQP